MASLAAPPVSGSTWRVAKDGTGDFAVIQDAVDVASNGDVIECISYGQGTFRDNHILRTGSGYATRCLTRSPPYPDIDLSGNWWGTTNLEEIAAGIWDRNDDDGVAHYVIFEPIADGPVPVEVRTPSGVKDLFR